MFFLHDFQIVHRSPITAPVGLYQDTNQEPGKLTNDQHKRQDKETQSTQPEQPEKNFKRSRTTQKEEFLAKEAQRIREYRARQRAASQPCAKRAKTNNKTIVAKRQHFPLISACAMTIHKSQGGTFPEVVYEYEKTHTQQLLYVALSRVTSIEGLYIVSRKNDINFYHGRRTNSKMASLVTEFQRLSLNRLQTVDIALRDFILTRQGLSLFTINCQGLRSHVHDIIDNVSSVCNFLLVSETNLSDEQSIDIPTFDCIVKFKRSHVRTGGVAIYHNENDYSHIVTSNMDIIMQNVMTASAAVSNVGDICSTQCTTNTGCIIIIITVYISPNQTIDAIKRFLLFHLLPYSEAAASIINENYHTLPIILTGDFNVNFADNAF